jgi:DNA-binding FadR family transcriptional regulator
MSMSTGSDPTLSGSAAAAGAAAAAPDAVQLVFDRLLAAIVGGVHGPGSHLPAERELARQLGSSRPTVREALRRLAAWRLVDARRGSGIRVRPEREWSFHVLPAYLRAGLGRPGFAPRMARLVIDMLDVRRGMLVEMLRVVSRRPLDLGPARAALQRALSARGPEFVRQDLEVTRAIVEAGGFLPALWILADLADVYFELAALVGSAGPTAEPPPGYQAAYEGLLAALDQGQNERACSLLSGYLEHHDGELLRRWGIQP